MKPRIDPSRLIPSQDFCPALSPRMHPHGGSQQDLLYPGLAACSEESTFYLTGATLISTSSTCGNTGRGGGVVVVMGLHQRDFRCLKTHCSCIPLSLPSSTLFGCSSATKRSGSGHGSRPRPQCPLLYRSVRILVANDRCKHCTPSPNTPLLSN